MSTSAAAAGRNDTVVNFMAQKLVFGGKIKMRLKKLIERLIIVKNATLVSMPFHFSLFDS